MSKVEWPKIWIGSVTDQSIGEKAAAMRTIQDLLNKHLKLPEYGSAIREIRFVFIAVGTENENHPDDVKYASRLRRLSVWRNIDYDKAQKASGEELIQLVVEKFIKTIEQVPSFGIRNFDHKAFQKDVLELLESNIGLQKAVA